MVGLLAHILKNRFYIGEVVYRGESNKGRARTIIDADLFTPTSSRLLAGNQSSAFPERFSAKSHRSFLDAIVKSRRF